jgi:hypothetical protein
MATATATATLMPTATRIPPSPTPCSTENTFQLTSQQLKRLGCPFRAGRNGTSSVDFNRPVISQKFERGFIIMFANNKGTFGEFGSGLNYAFYALDNKGNAWRVNLRNQQNALTFGDEDEAAALASGSWYSCNAKPGQRPGDSGVPWRETGRVWCTYIEVQRALGAVAPGEDPVTDATTKFQSFDSGRAFEFDGKAYVVFFDPDTNLSRVDIAQGRWE